MFIFITSQMLGFWYSGSTQGVLPILEWVLEWLVIDQWGDKYRSWECTFWKSLNTLALPRHPIPALWDTVKPIRVLSDFCDRLYMCFSWTVLGFALDWEQIFRKRSFLYLYLIKIDSSWESSWKGAVYTF